MYASVNAVTTFVAPGPEVTKITPALPGDDNQFLGMLGMHGTYEANNAMHDCDLLINIGARFDDRITGKIDEFSPKSKKVHIDIDPSSINKIIKVDLAIVGDVTDVIKSTTKTLKKKNLNLEKSNKQKISKWWQQIQKWRTCLLYTSPSPRDGLLSRMPSSA